MSVPKPVIDEQARAALDAIEQPLSVTTAVRDERGRLVDFRVVFVNLAAAAWAGRDRAALIGRHAAQVLPALRTTGLFERLAEVVETGAPYTRRGIDFEDHVDGGRAVSGTYDLAVMRLGDGYLSAWSLVGPGGSASGGPTPGGVDEAIRRARSAVHMARLEAAPRPLLRPRLAT